MKPAELVGARVAELRERLGMTQQQLGEALGELLPRPWPRQTVSAAEKGRRAFTAAELFALADALNVGASRLLECPRDAAPPAPALVERVDALAERVARLEAAS